MLWTDPLHIARLIGNLTSDQFVALCNDLLSETAAANGIDRSCFATNLHINEPDGGIDARCENAPRSVGRLIPSPDVAYQFKSGGPKGTMKIAQEDILGKQRVREWLLRGHPFVYIAAWDRGDEIESDLCEKVRLDGLKINDGLIVFIGVDAVARLLQAFPGLIAKYLRLEIPLKSLEHWSNFQSLRNPFRTDDGVDMQVRGLLTQIEPRQSVIRVVGAAGNGKTRIVLEALRTSPLASSVLYASQVDEIQPQFIAHLERTQDIQCTVVVDEVDDNNAQRLINGFSSVPPGVRLVMIGLDASGRSQSGTFQVEGLEEDLLVEVVTGIVPGLPLDDARSIARDCERSPKLAVIIAGRIKEDPSLIGPQRLLTDGTVQHALDLYLNIQPSTPEWDALSTTALLMRVGWKNEVEYESEALFRAVGLDPTSARRHVQSLHERFGIAPLAGRFRYISPAILADHLAVRQLGVWMRPRLIAVLSSFTPTMMEGFARRARRLSSALENRTAIEEVILGDQGPFRNLADLEDSGLAVLFRHLAAPFPRATLSALHRLIGNASSEELRAADKSRRDVVWALEQLLWPEATFERASDLLLRLAIAENETWGNNATNTWIETFQTMLGRTAANAVARARVLQRAATHPDPTAREVCARAIGKAFGVEDLHRVGMPPEDVEGMPAQEWRPVSYDEWADAVVSYLDILSPLLRDSNAVVRRAAADALSHAVAATFRLPPRVIEHWKGIALSLSTADFGLRAPVLEKISWAQERWEYAIDSEITKSPSETMSPPELSANVDRIRKRLDSLSVVAHALQNSDFSSRLRWAITCPATARKPNRLDEEAEVRARLESIAIEALAQPSLLDSEWEWLLELNAGKLSRAVIWIQILGGIDKERTLEATLDRFAAHSTTAAMLSSVYDLAYAQVSQDASFIRRRANELRRRGAPAIRVFDLVFRAGYSDLLLPLMLELFTSKAIAAGSINQLAYYPWGAEIPVAEALRLAESVENSAESPDEIVPFVYYYLHQVTEAVPAFRGLSMRLMLAPAAAQGNQGVIDEWSGLALMYVAERPLDIASVALQRIANQRLMGGDNLSEVLQKAWEYGDKAKLFMEVLVPWLLSDSNMFLLSIETRYRFPVEDIGVPLLIEWAESDPARRAPMLARIIGPPGTRPSELHAALLQRFGDLGVGDSFQFAFMAGTFMGSASDWILGKLDMAREWLEDERPVIRDWARRLIVYLEEDLRHQRTLEEEERLS